MIILIFKLKRNKEKEKEEKKNSVASKRTLLWGVLFLLISFLIFFLF